MVLGLSRRNCPPKRGGDRRSAEYRTARGWTPRPDDPVPNYPDSIATLHQRIAAIETHVAQEAARQALRIEREGLLAHLERWLAEIDETPVGDDGGVT